MATWHQQRAGLGALYAKPLKGHAVVINPPNECAARVNFTRKRDAQRYAKRVPHSIIISAQSARIVHMGMDS